MSQTSHTYGPTCHLAQKVSFSGSKGDNDIPHLRAHYFYCSPLPIDDPLSVVPAPSGSESKSVKHPMRPFSASDNDALEEAWLGLTSGKDKKHHKKYKESQTKKCPQGKKDAQSVKGSKSGKGSQIDQDTASGKGHKASTGTKQGKESKAESGSPQAKGCQLLHDEHGGPSNIPSSSADSSCSACPRTPSIAETAEAPRGNPYNPNCEDSHHIPMDTPASACCTDMEIDVIAGHQECIVDVEVVEFPEQSDNFKSSGAAKKGKHPTIRQDTGLPQRDGADERSSKKESKSPGHLAFIKHEHSKGHQEFESHLNAEHGGNFSDPLRMQHIPRPCNLQVSFLPVFPIKKMALV